MDSMGEVVSAISGVMGMGQAQMIHRQGLEVTHQLHREAIAQAERFHQQSMDFDLLSAMRENSRDIWAQKNNTCVRGVCCVAVGGALVPSSVPTWLTPAAARRCGSLHAGVLCGCGCRTVHRH